MSLHQQDYTRFAAGLLGWFGQAVASGQSSQAALQNVALTALTFALSQMAPPPAAPAPVAPATPPAAQPPVASVATALPPQVVPTATPV
jgi:hypothetical protein